MKTCLDCKQELPLTSFGANGKLPSGKPKIKARCNDCVTIYERNVFRKKIYEIVGGKENLKCATCGYNKILAGLDFHHVDPKQKDKPVNKMRNYSKKALQKEIDKCIILCACCHRELHYRLNNDEA